MRLTQTAALASTALCVLAFAAPAKAVPFTPGNLVVSRVVYSGAVNANGNPLQVGDRLPVAGTTAVASGAFPGVFNNEVNNGVTVDPNFGVTGTVMLDQYNPANQRVSTLALPTSGANAYSNSFSSKSEGALNLSTDGRSLTIIGYNSAPGRLDISNSSVPGVPDSKNTDLAPATYRAVAQVKADGTVEVSQFNVFAGDNPRAAIASPGGYLMVGNSNGNTGPALTAGLQIGTPGNTTTTRVNPFNINTVDDPATGQPYTANPTKIDKYNNFRGATVFNGILYVTKGSGGQGINSVFQVGAAGQLPTLATAGAEQITILPGFNTLLAGNDASTSFPFGIWFADENTLYVADEGPGTTAADPMAGLQKWTRGSDGVWRHDYTLQNGLIGTTYTPSGFAGPSTVTGLRNITGKVNGDGTATIYGLTATVGTPAIDADPNQLVSITDMLGFATAQQASAEAYNILQTAHSGEVFRGVAFAPVDAAAVPEPATFGVLGMGLIGLLAVRRRAWCSQDKRTGSAAAGTELS